MYRENTSARVQPLPVLLFLGARIGLDRKEYGNEAKLAI